MKLHSNDPRAYGYASTSVSPPVPERKGSLRHGTTKSLRTSVIPSQSETQLHNSHKNESLTAHDYELALSIDQMERDAWERQEYARRRRLEESRDPSLQRNEKKRKSVMKKFLNFTGIFQYAKLLHEDYGSDKLLGIKNDRAMPRSASRREYERQNGNNSYRESRNSAHLSPRPMEPPAPSLVAPPEPHLIRNGRESRRSTRSAMSPVHKRSHSAHSRPQAPSFGPPFEDDRQMSRPSDRRPQREGSLHRRKSSQSLWNGDSIDYLSDMPPSVPASRGIPNIGSRCYLNATMQCLIAIEPLHSYFVTDKHKNSITPEQQRNASQFGSSGKIAKACELLFNAIWHNLTDRGMINDFCNFLGAAGTSYDRNMQHDAQEYLMFILDRLHEDLNTAPHRDAKELASSQNFMESFLNHKRMNHSLITETFEGQMKTSMKCLECSYSKAKFEPFINLTLNVPILQQIYATFMREETPEPKGRLVLVTTSVELTDSIYDVKQQLARISNVNPSQLVFFQTYGPNFIFPYDEHSTKISQLHCGRFEFEETTRGLYLPRSGPLTYFTPLVPTQNTHEDEFLNVIFMMTVRGTRRFDSSPFKYSEPYLAVLSRQWPFRRMMLELFKSCRKLIKEQYIEHIKFEEFNIAIQTGLDEDSLVYLDASLSMPLYSQVVEQSIAINKQLQPSAPPHILMTIEWKHANWMRDDYREMPCYTTEAFDYMRGGKQPDLKVTWRNCLNSFTKEERIGWRCEKCSQPTASKSTKFSITPNYLIISLKRFVERGTPDNIQVF
ncbi:hypothetical protein WR25_12710 isoform E [Diploscapter pachys]|uniref:ubiquitinyl hydrolase 1 n=1 Tax=Diploscapter pachys TaxID=2018661 RepID=A0A2A2LLR1_9BILA|nr:hypothetical protein WR25_12710 isoform E [Diploscapter pachys]